jgi:hypothetical protein
LPLLLWLLAAKKKKLLRLHPHRLPRLPQHQLLMHPHQLLPHPLLRLLTLLPLPLPPLLPALPSNSSGSRKKPPQGGFFYGR